jgi:hypothetical protein
LVLKLPGHESLKAAFAEISSTLLTQWEGLFADELLRATGLGWQTTFIEFNIESLSGSYQIEASASMYCMLPPKVDENKENNQGLNKSKNKRPYQKLPPRSDVVGEFLTDFMVEARPTLEATYGVSKSLSTSTGDIETMMGRTTGLRINVYHQYALCPMVYVSLVFYLLEGLFACVHIFLICYVSAMKQFSIMDKTLFYVHKAGEPALCQ